MQIARKDSYDSRTVIIVNQNGSKVGSGYRFSYPVTSVNQNGNTVYVETADPMQRGVGSNVMEIRGSNLCRVSGRC